jgi:hypothetical protein
LQPQRLPAALIVPIALRGLFSLATGLLLLPPRLFILPAPFLITPLLLASPSPSRPPLVKP